jgi:hypothetical protein
MKELRPFYCRRSKCIAPLEISTNGYLILDVLYKALPENVNLPIDCLPKRIFIGNEFYNLAFIGRYNCSIRHFTCISVVSNSFIEYDCLSKNVLRVDRKLKIHPVLLFFVKQND